MLFQNMNLLDPPEMLQSPMVLQHLPITLPHTRLMAGLDLSTPLLRLIHRPTSSGESDTLLVFTTEEDNYLCDKNILKNKVNKWIQAIEFRDRVKYLFLKFLEKKSFFYIF